MKSYLGLDVGGTKTYCLVGDETGRVLGFGRAGTGSYEYRGVGPAAVENRKAVEEALAEAGLRLDDISGIGMGVAGADLPEDFEMLERELYTPLFGGIPRVFRNDSFAALRGGTRSPFGIAIVCGTGSVCAGRNPTGEETRVGGLGPEFGDRCTGTSIGEEGLRAVWRARDGIIGPTRLTDLFVERARCRDVEELFYKVYRRQIAPADLHPAAQLVFEAAVDEDDAACAILRDGGHYLGAMINAVARRLGMTEIAFEVVMAGGVFKGRSPALVDAMRQAVLAVCPKARLILPEFEPVVGAFIMGLEMDRPMTEATYRTLEEGLPALGARHGVLFKLE